MDILQTIIGGLLGGGIIGFIEFLIRRRDEKEDKNSEVLKEIEELKQKIDELAKKVDEVDAKGEERGAIQSRVRILRFMDEILEGRKHSKDSFDQVMSDITSYEWYCEQHPSFKNNQTATTVEYIKKNYQERLEKHDFL